MVHGYALVHEQENFLSGGGGGIWQGKGSGDGWGGKWGERGREVGGGKVGGKWGLGTPCPPLQLQNHHKQV